MAWDENDELIDRCISAGRARWPEVATSDNDLRQLRAKVSARLGEIEANPAYLADLFVAVAAHHGDPSASQWIHQRVTAVAPMVGQRIVPPSELDEVIQRVSVLLLVGVGGPPRIGSYGARGPLDAWLRTVILREALAVRRQAASAAVSTDESAWLELPILM